MYSCNVQRANDATNMNTKRNAHGEPTALHAHFDGLVTRSSGATCGSAKPTTLRRQKNRCAVVPKRGTLDPP